MAPLSKRRILAALQISTQLETRTPIPETPPMARSPAWTRDQLLTVFRLYCRTPFGQLHNRNPKIIALAEKIGRTPNAVAMKACNFASLDPTHRARGVKGLSNLARADTELWQQFQANPEAIAAEAEAAYVGLKHGIAPEPPMPRAEPTGPTEIERIVRARRVQRFFRRAVLVSYQNACALTGLAIPSLLNASHIIPWNADEKRRADPRNGIALNALHDRAFDRGLITFDENLRLLLSPRLQTKTPTTAHHAFLLQYENQPLRPPVRFTPDAIAMQYHREQVFQHE